MNRSYIIIGIVFVCTAVFCYGLIPSASLKYFWKRRSRKRVKEGKAGRRLYLTFDDGPSRAYTGQLLCLLKQYQIKASFFVVAKFARENADLIEWMKEEGHLVGIHSVQHKNALFRGRRFVYKDLGESARTLENMGCHVRYYRPPWGHLNLWTLLFIRNRQLRLILWDVMANDWSGRETAESIREKILNRVFPGAVLCLHDGRGTNGAPQRTIDALRESIPVLIERGYSFERMDAYEY